MQTNYQTRKLCVIGGNTYTFEPKPHRKKKSSRKKAPRRDSSNTISCTSSTSENKKSKSKTSKKSSSNNNIKSNRKSFDDKPKSDINSIETEPDPAGYDSESSSSTIFKITRANELSDKEVARNWRKYVHEFLCNTDDCEKFPYHLIHYLVFQHSLSLGQDFNPTKTNTYQVLIGGKVGNDFREFCRNVLKFSIGQYNKACCVGNVFHFKRAMMKQYPQKGVAEQPRAEYTS